jgi:AmmeMemoRadiSam system protein A
MNILNPDEKKILLIIARQALESAVMGVKNHPIDLNGLPKNLQEFGSSFVTLTVQDKLRGCIGSLEPSIPLVDDVREHAVAAALEDYRFPPVQPEELTKIQIEISYLTLPKPLTYGNPGELVYLLRPFIDGVVLKDGFRRATFLPQVWEKIPNPEDFLSNLCLKMGASAFLWKQKKLIVEVYQVEEFHE